jgi:hypothetical protein
MGKSVMAIYEVTYSAEAASNEELSYSDVVLVEAETHEELTAKVVDLIRKLGLQAIIMWIALEAIRMKLLLTSESLGR